MLLLYSNEDNRTFGFAIKNEITSKHYFMKYKSLLLGFLLLFFIQNSVAQEQEGGTRHETKKRVLA